jgi:hypothetical protein
VCIMPAAVPEDECGARTQIRARNNGNRSVALAGAGNPLHAVGLRLAGRHCPSC